MRPSLGCISRLASISWRIFTDRGNMHSDCFRQSISHAQKSEKESPEEGEKMSKYVIKRLLLMPVMVFVIMFIVFVLVNLVESNPALNILGMNASKEEIDALNEELGFNDPLLIRFISYIGDILQGDLGTSYIMRRPVLNEILQRLPNTLTLTFGCIILSICIGLPLGILCASRQYSGLDTISSTIAMCMGSIPSFLIGLILLLVFSQKLGWFPSGGVTSGIRSWVLPVLKIAAPYSATYLRYTRSSMLDTIRQDYVDTARAKGNSESAVIIKHAFRNALMPLVTITGLYVGGLMSSAVVVESVFSIPGIGLLVIDSIKTKDVPTVMGCILFLALIFLVVTLIMDVVNAYIDPRIKALYSRTQSKKRSAGD